MTRFRGATNRVMAPKCRSGEGERDSPAVVVDRCHSYPYLLALRERRSGEQAVDVGTEVDEHTERHHLDDGAVENPTFGVPGAERLPAVEFRTRQE